MNMPRMDITYRDGSIIMTGVGRVPSLDNNDVPEYARFTFLGRRGKGFDMEIVPATDKEISDICKDMLDVSPLYKLRDSYPNPSQWTRKYVLNTLEGNPVNVLYILHNLWSPTANKADIDEATLRFFQFVNKMKDLGVALTTPTNKWKGLDKTGFYERVTQKDIDGTDFYLFKSKPNRVLDEDIPHLYRQIGGECTQFFD
jgi:hypothetical protein